ncbi:hypothetical protein BLNAU_14385 [Blattamonas nauphoetae]|uniref:Uncharacterized protein n=1 Tax=Blattamonas nauphoetae TaxID=2049346 RepID=A0ABQ9XH37_9EUKA|nr:hypothetical protein BLNAU_14385 [Blattamonas nauphoetae]
MHLPFMRGLRNLGMRNTRRDDGQCVTVWTGSEEFCLLCLMSKLTVRLDETSPPISAELHTFRIVLHILTCSTLRLTQRTSREWQVAEHTLACWTSIHATSISSSVLQRRLSRSFVVHRRVNSIFISTSYQRSLFIQ